VTCCRLHRRELLWRFVATVAAGIGTAHWPEALAATRRPPRKMPLIVLDPGHGGVDPGCIGPSGIYEKDIVLSTARALAHALEASGRYRVQLTRSDDEYVPLTERVARARADNGELFLSIHADALPDAHLRGASVFTLSEQASDREAAALAARENKVDLVAGIDLSRHAPEVSNILFDLARRQTNNLSIRLARDLVSELSRRVQVLHNSHRAAGFVVLKAPDIPSALVEIGCLSNHQEEQLLQQPAYQRKLAAGLLQSVNDYFDFAAKV
jgi:N-acetylmuramoyl-L-alanine amidase